uniref:TRF2/HOY1 PH-like domain-containing protein n=1 Tax=Setaria italica TaxID=4555 RepID=K3YM88_SETIT
MIHKEFVPDSKAKGRCTPKPSKFHADILRIGDCQWTSRYQGDLVAKFYYSNRRLVWEILNGGLKMKIEIDWENIYALKFTYPESGLGTLEIMVCTFSKEANLQLGRNTAWMRTVDFTGGQATIHRNHRLYSLSQENTMHPCFENLHSESEVLESSNAQDLYSRNDYQQFGGHKLGAQLPMPVGTKVVGRNHDGSQSMR